MQDPSTQPIAAQSPISKANHAETADHVTAEHVTAVLLVYNNGDGACRVLDTVKAQHVRPGKIIVVDNGSRDGSAEQITAAHPDVTLLVQAENLGVGAGHNVGWRAAMADPDCAYIWTLEHDTLAEPDCLEALLTAHEFYYSSGDKLGVVFPTMLMPYDTDERLHLAFRFFAFRRLQQTPPDAEPNLRGGCTFNGTLYAVEVIHRIGMLNESFFFGREDSEFGLRCREAGIDLLLIPAARVYHNVFRDSRIIEVGNIVILTPGWASTFRIYYGMRNSIVLMQREHVWWKAWIRYGGGYLLAQLNDLIFGPNRLDRLRARTAAFRDGMQNRLGRASYPFLYHDR